ncbi:MAG: M15 family metallopeptidase [Clostridia bacterium]|nr:M15 family metallopeptidase [Clostridia bacterium]
MEEKITRKIYIAIGLVLCFTAIIMYKIQNTIILDASGVPKDFVEGYGDEKIGELDKTGIIETDYSKVNEDLVIEDYTDDTYWNVVLVNKMEPLSADRPITLGTLSNGKQLDKRIIDITEQMIKDAQNDGVSLIVCSGYRSYNYQQGLYNKEVNEWLSQGYSEQQAKDYASKEVAIPGTSEHQLGLAIDFITKGYTNLDQGFENTDAFKWLMENGYKYGWILRYMDGKQIYTGINYEPWHWRYLGPELAKEVKDSGLCYEEFLQRTYTFN